MSKPTLVAISGNLAAPSRTRALVEVVVDAVVEQIAVEVITIDIGELASELGALTNPKAIPPKVAAALQAIEKADLLVVGSPVYKGSYTGLFKHLIDFVAPEALIGVPVVLTATGGASRHALVIEHELRPLFGFFTAATAPTGVFALDSDFENYRLTSPDILARARQAANELVRLASLGRVAAPPQAAAAA